ncbi:MAG: ABC transporter ATP-binding protein [Fibrobacter sp.]|nr:ABC transporter ATP-binding protein [Fibrobacter sp.]MDY6368479.1 ABC transporter ATP-binding protein [Fibrobacter sp.]MDY6388728.1 ABC transporter ATP-binding protein [Fibrobacter sp.]
MNPFPAIEIRNLSFSYEKTLVLSDVNFSVDAGDFLAIIGPNGGGKSTLMKLIVGLLKPSEGDVRVFGEKVPSKKVSIGYVPQNTNRNLEFPITVAETVSTGLPLYKSNPQKVKEALETVKMESFAGRRLGELSGGERQRVLIARALAADPQILFLDEPSSNIDAQGQEDLYGLLAELNAKMTIVIVSHDLMVLSNHVKSVACVNRTVHFHSGSKITPEMVQSMYGCEVDLIAHGVPHRVLGTH